MENSIVVLRSLSIIMLSAIFDKVDVKEIGLRSLLKSLTVVTLGIGEDIRQFPDARDFVLTEEAVQSHR